MRIGDAQRANDDARSFGAVGRPALLTGSCLQKVVDSTVMIPFV